jgi:hypothetical protein
MYGTGIADLQLELSAEVSLMIDKLLRVSFDLLPSAISMILQEVTTVSGTSI